MRTIWASCSWTTRSSATDKFIRNSPINVDGLDAQLGILVGLKGHVSGHIASSHITTCMFEAKEHGLGVE